MPKKCNYNLHELSSLKVKIGDKVSKGAVLAVIENEKIKTSPEPTEEKIKPLVLKKEVFMPLCFPKCNKVMKGQLDKPNYRVLKNIIIYLKTIIN